MQVHQFKTEKIARVFTLGNIHTANDVWIVLHGYAQLASTFIEQFDFMVDHNTAVIAPEGLHRFYRRGFNGEVVASWMTKEDRLNDILDYVSFLNAVHAQFTNPRQRVNILGFSQGVATACRWLAESDLIPSNIVLWAGTFPSDITLEPGESVFNNTRTFLAYDSEDPFRTEESWNKQLVFFEKMGIQPELFEYEGKHSIPKPHLIRLIETHINPFLSD